MNKYLTIIKSNIIAILISGGIFYWGFVNDGYIRMGIAILILYVIIKSAIDHFNFILELDNWIKLNEGKLILFYPTKKTIQEKIKTHLIPKIPHELMEVYYDGPKIIGDVKRSIVIEIMKWNHSIKPHKPAILKVINKTVITEELEELKTFNQDNFDYQKLLDKIEKFNKAPNNMYKT